MKSFETSAFSSHLLIIDLILIDIGIFHLPVYPCMGFGINSLCLQVYLKYLGILYSVPLFSI